MKKSFLRIFIFFIAIQSGVSCSSSSDDSSSNNNPTANFIKFRYNNTDYNFPTPDTFDDTKKEVRGDQGINLQYKKISLWLPTDVTTGVHNVTVDPLNDNSYEIHFVSQSEGLYLDGSTGTINITSITSTLITGTFECTGTDANDDPITISSGSFQANRYEAN